MATATTSLLLLTCSGGADDKSKGEQISGPVESGDDGDLDVAPAVPMALMDGEFLASVDGALGPAITSQDAAPTPGANDFALAVLDSGARATGEMKRLLSGIQSLLDQIFGADGYFRGEEVALNATVGKRRFLLDAEPGEPAFIEVESTRKTPPTVTASRFGHTHRRTTPLSAARSSI